jgi:hypothetical protein
MIEVVVGTVAADRSHQGLSRRGHDVNLIAKFSIFSFSFLSPSQPASQPASRNDKVSHVPAGWQAESGERKEEKKLKLTPD